VDGVAEHRLSRMLLPGSWCSSRVAKHPRREERVNGFRRVVPWDDTASPQGSVGPRDVVVRSISSDADLSSVTEVPQGLAIAATAGPFWRNRCPSRRL